MKPATVHQLKKELQVLPQQDLVEICLRLARFKLENKELLNYLLFEAEDEDAYIRKVQTEMTALFQAIPRNHSFYLIKKSVRKILRLLNKNVRYSSRKDTEVELRIHFCKALKDNVAIERNRVLSNMYDTQLKKIRQTIDKLHEDLQYDYTRELEEM